MMGELDNYLKIKNKIMNKKSICKNCDKPIQFLDEVKNNKVILAIKCCEIQASVELDYADNYDIDTLEKEVDALKKLKYIKSLITGQRDDSDDELDNKIKILNKLQKEKENKITNLQQIFQESNKIIEELELSLYTLKNDIDTLRRVYSELQDNRRIQYSIVEELRKY
jgi:septal ring factor EnvC (AmiA/AmiB activator)